MKCEGCNGAGLIRPKNTGETLPCPICKGGNLDPFALRLLRADAARKAAKHRKQRRCPHLIPTMRKAKP